MKKLLFCLILFCLIMCDSRITANAYNENSISQYSVYTENGDFLFVRSEVDLGDKYITKDFKEYEIFDIDKKRNLAYAKFIKNIKKPHIKINPYPTRVAIPNKKIALYLTHNDESFVPTDGYDSIYGKGGIHDVAKHLAQCLTLLGVNVDLDETLHIPHDYKAYSRSEVTAKRLLNNKPNAMFDIHRDGAPRNFYVINNNGQEKCKVRIVVGQANPNKDKNLEFAIYLMSVGEKMYPWLFNDIYFAKGHYNQGLNNKILLFEMGSHLVEKDLVLNSINPLANVINTTLFETTVNEDTHDAEINGNVNEDNIIMNDFLEKEPIKKGNNTNALAGAAIISSILVTTSVVALGLCLILNDKK